MSAAVLLLIAFAWFGMDSPAGNFILYLGAIALSAAQAVIVLRRRRRNLITLASLAFWVLSVALMGLAGSEAQQAAVVQIEAMTQHTNCNDLQCFQPDGRRIRIASGEAWIVKRHGANVMIKLYIDHQTECRVHSDYFFGGSLVRRWFCKETSGQNR